MHATIPSMPSGIHHLLRYGIERDNHDNSLHGLIDRSEGMLLAEGMALLIKLGFGYLAAPGLTKQKSAAARQFFEDSFIMIDPQAEGGKRYYQGRIMIRTKKADDNMNVLIRFCPDPDALYTLHGDSKCFHPESIVDTTVLSEAEAEQIEHDPDRCDLVIRFKDSRSILGLAKRPDADVVQLLLENLVQITGNFGHMFKFGAIGNRAKNMLEH